MIPLYTELEYNESNSSDYLILQCCHCNNAFYSIKKLIKYELKTNRGGCKFCSTTCKYEHTKSVIETTCLFCNEKIVKRKSQITKNNFCNHKCATTYQNLHKAYGNRRSKLELYIEEQLKSLYPNLEILFNDKSTINSELDIYIPSLKLAFELNGIYHYEPIHGQDKLDKIVNNDNRKFQACLENNICLCIIDSSTHKYINTKTCMKYLNIVINVINKQSNLVT